MAPTTSTGGAGYTRAPPPTPIATGKGQRCAAVDDAVLAEFLSTLQPPSLTLPSRIPAEIELTSLIAREDAAVRRMLASAAVVGAFRVEGKGVVEAEEVRGAVEAGRAGWRIPEGMRRREMAGCFGRREGVGEEFYWDWRRSAETEEVLGKAWPGNYRAFSEKMESLASKLEMVAQCLQTTVSKHLKNQTPFHGKHRVRSILCLRKYDPIYFGGDSSEPVDAKHLQYPVLMLHLYGDDHRFCIRCPEGSVSSGVSSASILVTVDEQIQGWCNEAFKSPSEESFYEPSFAPTFSRSMRRIPSLKALKAPSSKRKNTIKMITITDQLFILLVFSFLYKFCACIFLKFT